MHSTLSTIIFAFILIIHQTIYVQSLISPIVSPDNEAGRPNLARRLRAPLMGRSLLSASDDNNIKLINGESDSESFDDTDNLVVLGKRRSGVPLFGRRASYNKRRGPLFG